MYDLVMIAIFLQAILKHIEFVFIHVFIHGYCDFIAKQQYFFCQRQASSPYSTFNYFLPTDCSEPPTPANGKVDIPGNTTYGQKATFSCLPGYDLLGHMNVSCAENGQWSGSANCIIKGDVTIQHTPIRQHGDISRCR